MPTLYTYRKIKFIMYTDDHYPIHIHIRYNGYEIKASIYKQSNTLSYKLSGIDLIKIPKSKLKEIQAVIRHYKQDIVEKWVKIRSFDTSFRTIHITRLRKK